MTLQARNDEPAARPAGVDQLFRREAGPRTQVGEVTLHSARPDAHELGRVEDGSTSGHIGGKHVPLARSRWSPELVAQVAVSHALRAVAAGRDSLGVQLIITKRRDC